MFVGPAVLLVRVGAVRSDDVDVSRDDQAEHLLARPERPRLQDGRLRHLAVPRGQEHQQVHHLTLQGDEQDITSCLHAFTSCLCESSFVGDFAPCDCYKDLCFCACVCLK